MRESSNSCSVHLESFQRILNCWQQQHGRHDLPWQTDPTPYRVWVSEIMLQQTQVQTVIPYFERWMTQFPSLEALACAALDDVMACWQGLGYYSRARNLHRGAQYVVENLNGAIPDSTDALLKIPGIGPYTAGAIVCFAYDQPAALVDGNIKRLFCRLFGVEGQPADRPTTQAIWHLAEQLTPESKNRVHAQALLDLGALICTPKTPACAKCPLTEMCFAHQAQRIADFPTPTTKRSKPNREYCFGWLEYEGRILLQKRQHSVWRELWCLPQLDELPRDSTVKAEFKHQLTHFQMMGRVIELSHHVELEQSDWFTPQEMQSLGLPTPIRRLIDQHVLQNAA